MPRITGAAILYSRVAPQTLILTTIKQNDASSRKSIIKICTWLCWAVAASKNHWTSFIFGWHFIRFCLRLILCAFSKKKFGYKMLLRLSRFVFIFQLKFLLWHQIVVIFGSHLWNQNENRAEKIRLKSVFHYYDTCFRRHSVTNWHAAKSSNSIKNGRE